MADSKYSNLARKQEFQENDPFAELTRIIGFEPNGARPLPAASDAGLGIDLEKELMGEFGDPEKLDDLGGGYSDADALVWDADRRDTEQEDIAAANDSQFDEAFQQAVDDEQDHPVAEALPQVQEPSFVEADEQGFAFDAALDAELSREAESWVFEEEQADAVAAEEQAEHVVQEPSLEEPQPQLVVAEPYEPAAEELPQAEPDMPELVVDEASFAADAGQVEVRQGDVENIELDFVDMDFGAFEAETPTGFAEAETVVSAAPAPVADANIEDELAALLGSFRPAPEAEPAVARDAADYDFGDILADAPEAATAPVADVVEAARDWQPQEDAGWDMEDVFADEAQPAAEAAEATSWQHELGGPAVHEPVSESDILNDLAAEVAAQEPVAAAPAARDPFVALAAMAATPVPQFSRVNLSPTGPYAAEPRQEQAYARPVAQAEPVAGMDSDEDDVLAGIESVEIHETAIAVADDLDLPEVEYHEAVAATEFDELDHDLHGLSSEQQPAEPVAQPAAYAEPASFAEDELRAAVERAFEEEPIAVRPYEPAPAAAASAAAFAPQAAAARSEQPADFDPDFNFDEVFGYDPHPEEHVEPARPGLLANRRNLLMAAAAVVAVVVAGGAGAFFLGGGSEGSGPALVQADEGPFKMRPENPGGTTVPNQNREVYERVTSGPTEAAPAQEKLVSTVEEPIDVATRIPALPATTPAPADTADAAPAALEPVALEPAAEETASAEAGSPPPMVEDFTIPMKSEERLAPTPTAEQEAEASDIALVTPRKVQTFIVRPDGTMVPNEPPVQEAALPAQEDVAAAETMRETQPTAPAAVAEQAQPAAPAQGTVQPEAMAALAPASEAGAEAGDRATGAAVTPASVPIAPPRPADQPVDIVGEVRRDQAPVEPQSQAAASGWAMQIASQPSAESAQATYAGLASRYGEVIGGRGVNIVKAEVTGKGTYYRVRVPAGSRSEAIDLCEQYKSAGGSCFVSQ